PPVRRPLRPPPFPYATLFRSPTSPSPPRNVTSRWWSLFNRECSPSPSIPRREATGPAPAAGVLEEPHLLRWRGGVLRRRLAAGFLQDLRQLRHARLDGRAQRGLVPRCRRVVHRHHDHVTEAARLAVNA